MVKVTYQLTPRPPPLITIPLFCSAYAHVGWAPSNQETGIVKIRSYLLSYLSMDGRTDGRTDRQDADYHTTSSAGGCIYLYLGTQQSTYII